MKVVSENDSVRPVSLGGAQSGAAMDRVIEKKKLPLKKFALPALVVAVLGLIAWMMLGESSGRTLVVDNSRVVISEVKKCRCGAGYS